MTTNEERKRLYAEERLALLHLCAALQGFASASALDKRIASIKGAKSMVNGAKGMLGKVLEEIYDTVPLEQLLSIKRQLKGLRYSISIQNVGGKDYKNDGLYLSLDTLDALLEGVRDHCMMCMKDTTEQRKCALAKALDELPCINADENAKGCRYFCGL